MTLSWSEPTAVDSLVGALHSLSALAAHRPGKETAIIASVATQLDGDTMALLETLLAEAHKENG